MKRTVYLGALLSLFLIAPLFSEDYTVTRTMFIPAVYHVGDTVEMRLSLRTAFAKKLVVPKEIAQPSWGTVSNLRLVEREDEPELRLSFTSYSAGTRSLPSINLGPVSLEGINIYVTSLLPAATEMASLSGFREQILIPLTIPKVLLQIFLMVIVPVLLFLCAVQARKFLKRFFSGRRDGQPWRRLQRSLHAMDASIETFDARSFYIRLLEETRLYLSDRLKIPAYSATSSELEKSLLDHVHNQDSVHALIAMFRHGDRVKFAGEPASIQSRSKDLQTLENALLHIEHEEHTRNIKGAQHVDA